ncbi:hypothetical protein [Paenibacillus sp. ISL-20]|uniref:hypothetical protein n=1 Tax=Paenibacillus sp. ISL-20 TaxID=2819163 RepID=UPI001BE98DC0|nr:hypothetical protein [Paenibacillus sp. ISL-20]MBT2764038.1 hypothetical protein [Paenibacillus sp. ISL-20]
MTYKLVKESRNANEINRKATEEQVRILTSPYIHSSITINDGRLSITLTNASPVPAYDVDVWISGYYRFEEIENILSKTTRQVIDRENLNDEAAVYSNDRILYPIFPNGQQVSAALKFPIVTDSVSVFIQYRDSRAENYSYDVWFLDDSDGNRKSYQIGAVDPSGTFLSKRFDPFDDLKKFEPSHYPEHINNFVKRYTNRVYLEVPRINDYVVEDRGEWKIIK